MPYMSNTPDPQREVLTIAQACARTGVSRATIGNWIQAGQIEGYRTPGGRVRIYADTLYRPFPAPAPDQPAA